MKPEGKLNGTWEPRGYSDTEYLGDNDTRERVTGYIVLVNGFFIAQSFRIKEKLHDMLQKLNIQKPYMHVVKSYFSMQFYCLWELLLFTLLHCMLITLELYSYQRTYRHTNGQIIYTYITISFGTTLITEQIRSNLYIKKKNYQTRIPRNKVTEFLNFL